MLIGGILSATDPVAVVALLREMGVKKSLATLIEAESLLNDGTAVVVYSILLKAVQAGGLSEWLDESSEMGGWYVLWVAFRMSVLGPLLGLGLGVISVHWLEANAGADRDANVEVICTLAMPFLVFYLAETVPRRTKRLEPGRALASQRALALPRGVEHLPSPSRISLCATPSLSPWPTHCPLPPGFWRGDANEWRPRRRVLRPRLRLALRQDPGGPWRRALPSRVLGDGEHGHMHTPSTLLWRCPPLSIHCLSSRRLSLARDRTVTGMWLCHPAVLRLHCTAQPCIPRS